MSNPDQEWRDDATKTAAKRRLDAEVFAARGCRTEVLEHVLAERRSALATKAERTPEVVLRAMLRAYEAAALEAEIAYFSTDDDDRWADVRRKDVTRWCEDVRGELAAMIADNHQRFDWPQCVHLDYEARLRGERPLDAPPMET